MQSVAVPSAVNGSRVHWELLVEQLTNSLPAMIWMCAPDGRVCYLNTHWLAFTGLALEQGLGEGWRTAVHPEDLASRLEAQDFAFRSRQAFEAEYRLRRADGDYRWMLDRGAPQLTGNGDLRGYVGVTVDLTERKLAEEDLRWLSQAVEQSPGTVVITGLDGNIQYVNRRFSETTGYSFEEALGKNPRILKSGEMSPENYRQLWETISAGQEWRGEFHNKRKNGELYWEAASIRAIRDAGGRPTHYLAVKEDITGRKRMEAALKASEERFRIAAECASDSIYEWDIQAGRVEIFSAGNAYAAGPVEDWLPSLYAEDRDRVLAAFRRHAASGEPLQQTYRSTDRDGQIRYYEDHGAPFQFQDGKATRWIGAVRDITERTRAEEVTARLAAIVQSSSDAILTFDRDGTIQTWNPGAEALYGYLPDEILGQPAWLLIDPERFDSADKKVMGTLEGQSFPPYESRHVRKDGSIIPVSVTISALRKGDAITGCGVIVRNTSEQLRAQRALLESENRFRAIVQNTSEAITLVDAEGIVRYDSPGILDLLGNGTEERVGLEVFQWVHPEDLSFARMLHAELLHEPGSKLRAQIRLLRSDGTARWCDVAVINLLHEPGVQAVVLNFRDITEQKSMEIALRESEQRYRKLFEDANDCIYTMDLEGNFTSVNSSTEKLTGYSRQELLGMNYWQVAAPECVPAIRHNLQTRLGGGNPPPIEIEILSRNGLRCAVEVSGQLQFRNGGPIGLLGIARDIRERKRMEKLEHHRREVLEMVAQNRPLEAVLQRLLENIEGYYADAVAWVSLAGQPCTLDCDAKKRATQARKFQGRVEVPIQCSDGGSLGALEVYRPERWEVAEAERSFLESNAKLASIALEHRELTYRLSHQAQHDALTGLPNRILLADRLRQAMALAGRQNKLIALAYLDLDRFKYVNDTLGHAIGDMLLRDVAVRLQAVLRKSDTLARTGGDEFVAVLFGLESATDAQMAAGRLVDAMREPFEVEGHELFVSLSVGISIFPHDGVDSATLQKHADVALYEAKNRGRNGFQRFSNEMNATSAERLEIENHLHRAVDRNELVLYYQPQFRLPGGQLAGLEALLRWNHPKWGLVPPNRFIPVAEESGLIRPISLWVLQETCRQQQAWRRAGYPPIRVAINISATQFTYSNLAKEVAVTLARYDIEPRYLEVELTEGVVMRDTADSLRQIADLRALGVSVSIDDFGTGYSSLSYLQRLPIDDLKIDKCFVQGVDQPGSTGPLVQAIVGLAHGLNMTATAEGVETESQLAALRALGCDRIQGFLTGRPAPPEQVERFWKHAGPPVPEAEARCYPVLPPASPEPLPHVV